jgi:ADP-L-glycero-D-manno-heptose 6-epimerase
MASVVLKAFDQIRERGTVRLFKSHRPDVADGKQQRDFVCVEDVIDVLLFASERPIPRGVFNLGTGEARTFLDLAHATFAAMGKEPSIEFIDTPAGIRDKYQYFTQATMDKLRAAGWERPFRSLEQGVAEYVRRLQRVSG